MKQAVARAEHKGRAVEYRTLADWTDPATGDAE